ncbi:MAG: OmpA family protein [Bacteroidetes bacterium]|nr:OmpA family protein [Bacteroidota bacterium]
MKQPLIAVFILLCCSQQLHAQTYERSALRLGLCGGVNVGGEEATLKYAAYTAHPYGTLSLEHYMADNIAVTASLYAGTLKAESIGRPLFPEFGTQVITGYDSKYYGVAGGLSFVLPRVVGLTPVIRPRLGLLMHHTRVSGERGFDRRISRGALTYGLGGGFEYPLSPVVSFSFGYDLVLTNSDVLDGLKSGNHNDALSVFTAGINILIHPGGEPQRLRRPEEQRIASLGPSTETGTPRDMRNAGREDAGTGEKSARDDTVGGMQGITLRPGRPSVPEDFHPPEKEGVLRLDTRLMIEPIERLSDLEQNPGRFSFRARQTGTDPMQLRCYVEFLRDGIPFYQGNVDLVLRRKESVFTADQFLNLPQLLDRNDGYALLPRGNYLIRVSAVAWDHDLSSLSKAKFLNVDLRPIFGNKEVQARDIIVERAVDVAAEGQEELMVNFFRAPEAAAERSRRGQADRENKRAPLQLAPPTMKAEEREHYLATEIEHSMREGRKLQSLTGSIGRSQNLKIVLSEVFFPMDSDMLNDEARIILDNVARMLNQHPELQAEIRGYASDAGDESHNVLLARRRAQRVLEYLVRQRTHAYRLILGAPRGRQSRPAAGEDMRMARKVEIVLRNRGM